MTPLVCTPTGAALEGTELRRETSICGFLRKSSVFCGSLRPLQMLELPGEEVNLRKSAAVCSFLWTSAFWAQSVTPQVRPLKHALI